MSEERWSDTDGDEVPETIRSEILYTYNSRGILTDLISRSYYYPSAVIEFSLHNEINPKGLVELQIESHTYDDLSTPESPDVNWGEFYINHEYDKKDNLIRLTYGDRVSEYNSYDMYGNPALIIVGNDLDQDGSIDQIIRQREMSYTYDNQGNMLTRHTVMYTEQFSSITLDQFVYDNKDNILRWESVSTIDYYDNTYIPDQSSKTIITRQWDDDILLMESYSRDYGNDGLVDNKTVTTWNYSKL